MDREIVSSFEKVESQVQAIVAEISKLAAKKPDDAVNPFKLNLVNTVLLQANELLGEDYKPFVGFTEFNPDEVPTNSDVLFICSQYTGCLEKLRADNIEMDSRLRWYWVINGKMSGIRTSPPAKLGKNK